MPGGDETTITALFQFCGDILNWLPPFLFLVFLETTRSMRIGLLAAPFMHGVGLLILLTINMEKGKQEIATTMKLRAGVWATLAAAQAAGDLTGAVDEYSAQSIMDRGDDWKQVLRHASDKHGPRADEKPRPGPVQVAPAPSV